MQAVQSGMSDGVKQGEGAMANINAGITNVTGAVTEMGGDVAAQLEKGKAQATEGMTAVQGMTDNMKNKALDWKTRAQAKIAENAAAKAGKSAQDLLDEVVPNKNPLHLGEKAVTGVIDGISATGEYMGARKKEGEEGFKRGVEEFHSQKGQEAQIASGGRRRRRRRTRRKKRRKSRKSRRRKRRKSRKKKRRRSRKKTRRRRRR